jgi:ABC-type antimicrobial peptide transport system permease subunit
MQDIRFALRLLKSSPGFTAVAILSLALGIGANTAIFSIMDAVMLKMLPVKNPQELVQVNIGKGGSFTNPIWEQLRDRQDVFSGVFAWSTERYNLASGGEAQYVDGLMASGAYFETLGVPPAAGRLFGRADDRRGCAAMAVLGYGFWQSRYGGRDAVGEKILLDGHPFEIIGVSAPGFFGTDVGRTFGVAIPICDEPVIRGENTMLDGRSAWWLRVIGRPKPGVGQAQVTARLKAIAPGVFDATVPPNWRQEMQSSYRKRSFEIAAARQREIAVRLAIGASRWRILRQLLTESVLLSVLGAVLGLAFARWGSMLLVRMITTSNSTLFLDLRIDWRMLGFTAAVAILTGILFGLAPAWRSTRLALNASLKEGGRANTSGRSQFQLGRALVAVQVGLSLLLLVGAGLFVRTFLNLTEMDMGFTRQNVLLVNIGIRALNTPVAQRQALLDELVERVKSIPSVQSASQSKLIPVSGGGWNDVIHPDGYTPSGKDDLLVWFNRVSPRYFETLGTPLLAGRDFDSHDTLNGPKVAIVNETAARRFFGNSSPIGKTYREDDPGGRRKEVFQIVGVVRDARYTNLRSDDVGTVYVPMSQEPKPGQGTNLEIRSKLAAASLTSDVKQVLASVDGRISLNFKTLERQVEESILGERLLAALGGFFAILALLLASVGLYGVISYMVNRRRNEIGIRMALGASRGPVLWLVLREVGLLVGAGLVLGTGAALGTTKFLRTILFGVAAKDAVTIAGAAALLGMVAAAAGFVPARRASRIEPMEALREE